MYSFSKIGVIALLFSMMLATSACVSPSSVTSDFIDDAVKEETEEEANVISNLIGSAKSAEERNLRMHCIVYAYALAANYRVKTVDPEQAGEVLGNIIRLENTIANLTEANRDIYFSESDTSLAALALFNVVVKVAEDSVRKSVLGILDGIDLRRVKERIALRGAQLFIVRGVIKDIRIILNNYQDGIWTYEEVLVAIKLRLRGIKEGLVT